MNPKTIRYRIDTMDAALDIFHKMTAKIAKWKEKYTNYDYSIDLTPDNQDKAVITIKITEKDAQTDDTGVYEEISK